MAAGGGRGDIRASLVRRASESLARQGVRWHMALFVAATTGIGVLASIVLLAIGLKIMWLRYMLAAAIAYIGFLVLVRWWIRLTGADGSPPGDPDGEALGDALDTAYYAADDLDLALPDIPASADFTVPKGASNALNGMGFDVPDLGDVDGDAAPLVLVVILAAVALGGLFAAGFMIYSAPVFFAEVFVDAGLGYGLYRRLRTSESHNWLQTAFSHTWFPFLIVAVLFGLAGAAIHEFVPHAVSIGDVFR